MTAQENPYRNDDPLLDDLSVSELEDMLEQAENALHSIRMELRERTFEQAEKLTKDDIEQIMPKKNLDESVGHWSDFITFLRDFVGKKPAGASK